MVIRINYQKSYFNNYSEKLFCRAYCFNGQFNQDSFFIKHIKFEKRKALKKMKNEGLMPIARHWHFLLVRYFKCLFQSNNFLNKKFLHDNSYKKNHVLIRCVLLTGLFFFKKRAFHSFFDCFFESFYNQKQLPK